MKNISQSILFSALFFALLLKSVSASELYWYLGASMTKPGQEIVRTFNNSNASFTVFLITGGSGQLLSKITASGKGDLYTPAGLHYIDKVKKLDLLKNYQELIVQTPVFALSSEGAKKIKTLSDLTAPGRRIGLGNPETMALGRSYIHIQKKMTKKLTMAIQHNMVVKAMNVSQIINYLKTGIIDAGIAFDSTAKVNKLTYIEIPPAYNHVETAPIITLTSETDESNTRLFVQFILDHMDIFLKHGFKSAFSNES